MGSVLGRCRCKKRLKRRHLKNRCSREAKLIFVRRFLYTLVAVPLVVLWAIRQPASLAAQVGHPPEASPYRDIRSRQSITANFGYLSGSAGRVGVGPSGGFFGGARWDARLGGPTNAYVGVSRASLERLIINPPDTSGPVTQSVFIADAGLHILLTGTKTWRRIAPFVGASMGLAFGASVPDDSSGYSFRTKFNTGPLGGIRWYPSDAFTVRLEVRLIFWQLKYPTSFFTEVSPGVGPVLNPETDPDAEWTAHPTLAISLGYAFGF